MSQSTNTSSDNCYHDIESIKETVMRHFQTKFGDNFNNRHDNAVNRINHLCIELSSEGINLLARTNLVTGREYNMMNDPNYHYNIPNHIGFHSNFTGKPLIISIMDDRNLANNHMFRSNENYTKIVDIMSEFDL